jgi:hypothetical protein
MPAIASSKPKPGKAEMNTHLLSGHIEEGLSRRGLVQAFHAAASNFFVDAGIGSRIVSSSR